MLVCPHTTMACRYRHSLSQTKGIYSQTGHEWACFLPKNWNWCIQAWVHNVLHCFWTLEMSLVLYHMPWRNTTAKPYVDIISNAYKGSFLQDICGQQLTEPIPLRVGIKTGCPWSAVNFIFIWLKWLWLSMPVCPSPCAVTEPSTGVCWWFSDLQRAECYQRHALLHRLLFVNGLGWKWKTQNMQCSMKT